MSAARSAKPPCARCGRAIGNSWAHWPEGYLCMTCRTYALETYGPCAGCGADRLTPGIAPGGGRLCTDCAGGLGDFACDICGRERIRYRRGACGNCVLAERLAVLLDDGTGRVRPELAPFATAFCPMRRPRGGITWLGRPHVQKMLRTLADPVTHETLNGMSPWRSVAYLRDLLMLHGVLPAGAARSCPGCPSPTRTPPTRHRSASGSAWTCSNGSSPTRKPTCLPVSPRS